METTEEIVKILTDYRVGNFVLGFLLAVFLYWYSTKNHDYWKKQGVPYDKPYPFIGSLISAFGKKTIEELELERYSKLGKIYGFYELNKPVIAIAEPELLRNILVKDFHYFPHRRIFNTGDPVFDKALSIVGGEDWRRIRTIVSPTFSTGKIKKVIGIFQESAKTLIQNFKMAASKSEHVDVLRNFGAFTMDVIASSAFSTKIDSHKDSENDFVKNAKAIFQQSFGIKMLLQMMFPNLMRTLGVRLFSGDQYDFFKKVTLEIIETRKKTGQTRNDFLQLLLDTTSETNEDYKWDKTTDSTLQNYGDDSVNHPFLKNASTKHLSMDELIAQCVIFFLAGYHTTSTALSLTTYLLALNQDKQEKLFEEIEDVLNISNGELTYESIQKMKYLDNIISESLRIYSPVIRLERTAEADYKLGDTGITIPKGMLVRIPSFAMHRDSELFHEPEKFNPDRFESGEKEKLIPFTYLPFGAGPRNCVGMRFALIEIKVCLVYFLSVFQVNTCTNSKIPLVFGKSTGLIKPKAVELDIKARKKCPLKF